MISGHTTLKQLRSAERERIFIELLRMCAKWQIVTDLFVIKWVLRKQEFDVAIYLDENMVGADPNVIVYPTLLLCMGVTILMDDGTLVGAHVSDGATEVVVLGKLAQAVGNLAPGVLPVHLYCTGNWHNHTAHGGMTIQQKAAALGFHGPAYRFDTPDYTAGTFVRVTSNGGNHKCSIEYKKDNKVAYDINGVGAAVERYSLFRQAWANVNTPKAGLTNPVHHPHQVSFLLQVRRYDIP